MTRASSADERRALVLCTLFSLPVATYVASRRDFAEDSPRPSVGRASTRSSPMDGGSAGRDGENGLEPSNA
jgi:hypothetical protein